MKRFLPFAFVAAALIVATPAFGDEPKQPAKDEAKKAKVKTVEAKKVDAKKQKVQVQFRAVASIVVGRNLLNPITMVRMPKVKEEIKLTDEQDVKIQEAFTNLKIKQRELYADIRKVPANERAQKYAELREKVQALQNETYETIKKSLKPEQSVRLDELAIQRQGIRALTTKDVATKLKISDEQQKKVAAAFQEQQASTQKLAQELRNQAIDHNQYQEKIQELQQRTDKKIMVDILTMAQQTRFKQMQGKKFDFGMPNIRAVPFRAIQLKIQPQQLKKLKIQAVPAEKPEK